MRLVGERRWLIKKNGLFYRPNFSGYTGAKIEAGRYTEAEAKREIKIEPWHMKALHEDEVPDDPAIVAAIAEARDKAFEEAAEIADAAEKVAEGGINRAKDMFFGGAELRTAYAHTKAQAKSIAALIRSLKSRKDE